MSIKILLNTRQICDLLQIDRNTLYRQIQRGLPAIRIGKSWRYDKRKVLEWLENQNDQRGG